jgi:hypothetical protein
MVHVSFEYWTEICGMFKQRTWAHPYEYLQNKHKSCHHGAQTSWLTNHLVSTVPPHRSKAWDV